MTPEYGDIEERCMSAEVHTEPQKLISQLKINKRHPVDALIQALEDHDDATVSTLMECFGLEDMCTYSYAISCLLKEEEAVDFKYLLQKKFIEKVKLNPGSAFAIVLKLCKAKKDFFQFNWFREAIKSFIESFITDEDEIKKLLSGIIYIAQSHIDTREDTYKWLLDMGADFNAMLKTSKGVITTGLHLAVALYIKGRPWLLELLIHEAKEKLDFTVQDSNGVTPLAMASAGVAGVDVKNRCIAAAKLIFENCEVDASAYPKSTSNDLKYPWLQFYYCKALPLLSSEEGLNSEERLDKAIQYLGQAVAGGLERQSPPCFQKIAFSKLKAHLDRSRPMHLFYLALCYLDGYQEIHDKTLGFELLKKAAKKGYLPAINKAMEMIIQGDILVPDNAHDRSKKQIFICDMINAADRLLDKISAYDSDEKYNLLVDQVKRFFKLAIAALEANEETLPQVLDSNQEKNDYQRLAKDRVHTSLNEALSTLGLFDTRIESQRTTDNYLHNEEAPSSSGEILAASSEPSNPLQNSQFIYRAEL